MTSTTRRQRTVKTTDLPFFLIQPRALLYDRSSRLSYSSHPRSLGDCRYGQAHKMNPPHLGAHKKCKPSVLFHILLQKFWWQTLNRVLTSKHLLFSQGQTYVAVRNLFSSAPAPASLFSPRRFCPPFRTQCNFRSSAHGPLWVCPGIRRLVQPSMTQGF